MGRLGLIVVATAALAGCESSSDNTAQTVPTQAAPGTGTGTGAGTGGSTGGSGTGSGGTGTGSGSGTPTPAPAPSMTSTSTSASSFAQSGNTYVRGTSTTPITMVQTNSTKGSETARYDLTVNGVTYTLVGDPGNMRGDPNNFHSGSAGGNQVTLFQDEAAQNAKIINPQVTDANGMTTEFFGILGTLSDTATLPTSATYAGRGEITIDSAKGIFDDAPASTVTMDVDFASGTLTGQFDVTDGPGENSGNFDINGTAVLPMTGTVTGAEFSADVDYSGLVAITNGLNAVDAQPVQGGFFGTGGAEAVGIGLSQGDAFGSGDAVVYTRVQATKQ